MVPFVLGMVYLLSPGNLEDAINSGALSELGVQKCEKGSFLNVHGGNCAGCPRGKFAPQTSGHETECKACPDGKHAQHKKSEGCAADDSTVSYHCGDPTIGPVLGGIDFVDIVDTYSLEHRKVVPRKGNEAFKTTTSQTGNYEFWFLNEKVGFPTTFFSPLLSLYLK